MVFQNRRKQKRVALSEAMAVPHAALDDPPGPGTERVAWQVLWQVLVVSPWFTMFFVTLWETNITAMENHHSSWENSL